MGYMRIPYIYGGQDPKVGLDCSGFVWNVLQDLKINPKEDLSAQGLYQYYLPNSLVVNPGQCDLGDLLFFGSTSGIHHVAIALNNKFMIEAAHGDSTITSIELAQKKGAYVNTSPISRMKDIYICLRLNNLIFN